MINTELSFFLQKGYKKFSKLVLVDHQVLREETRIIEMYNK